MKRYIGLTIGPISDMMSHATTPLSLWAASYLFSYLSKNLCMALCDDGVPEDDILTPYYHKDEPLIQQNDGIGLFYDRIVFKAEDYDLSRLVSVKEKALRAVSEGFNLDYDYVKDYIMIEAAAFYAEKPLPESQPILDSFELATPFVAQEDENPIIKLFSGDKQSKNSELKAIPVLKQIENFQLRKKDSTIVSLLDIVTGGRDDKKVRDYKKFKYFAIVRADGDNMHTINASLQTEDEMRLFSKRCLSYCSRIAGKVKEFGGVTIYAGGDDLLAILPCENEQDKTPFHFACEANEIFREHFAGYAADTSLSFGIVMDYHSSPLYEALEQSADLLFGVVKSGAKNSLAVTLHKSSGQSEGLLIPNEKLVDILDLMSFIRSAEDAKESKDRVFLSAMYTIAMLEDCFNRAETETEVRNLFHNFFDGHNQDKNIFLHEKLPALLNKLREDKACICSLDDEGIKEHNPTETLCYILRMLRFFFEKGGANE